MAEGGSGSGPPRIDLTIPDTDLTPCNFTLRLNGDPNYTHFTPEYVQTFFERNPDDVYDLDPNLYVNTLTALYKLGFLDGVSFSLDRVAIENYTYRFNILEQFVYRMASCLSPDLVDRHRMRRKRLDYQELERRSREEYSWDPTLYSDTLDAMRDNGFIELGRDYTIDQMEAIVRRRPGKFSDNIVVRHGKRRERVDMNALGARIRSDQEERAAQLERRSRLEYAEDPKLYSDTLDALRENKLIWLRRDYVIDQMEAIVMANPAIFPENLVARHAERRVRVNVELERRSREEYANDPTLYSDTLVAMRERKLISARRDYTIDQVEEIVMGNTHRFPENLVARHNNRRLECVRAELLAAGLASAELISNQRNARPEQDSGIQEDLEEEAEGAVGGVLEGAVGSVVEEAFGEQVRNPFRRENPYSDVETVYMNGSVTPTWVRGPRAGERYTGSIMNMSYLNNDDFINPEMRQIYRNTGGSRPSDALRGRTQSAQRDDARDPNYRGSTIDPSILGNYADFINLDMRNLQKKHRRDDDQPPPPAF